VVQVEASTDFERMLNIDMMPSCTVSCALTQTEV
jgi:hypothetical protein